MAKRILSTKAYENGGFGEQAASIWYDDGLAADGYRISRARFGVSSHDHFAHATLADAKRHYRSIGAN